jgi:DNA adenine methylase
MIRSPLTYYGRKGTIAPWLIENFPPHDLYVEPFVGSGAVVMTKPKTEKEIICDIDPELVNFHLQVRDNWRLLKSICRHDFRKEFFLWALDNYKTITDPLEAARAYYSTNRQAYRGLPRTRSWDERKPREFLGGLQRFEAAANRLAGVAIRCLHYRTALLLHDGPETFFYMDPPYLFPERPGSVQQRFRDDGVYWHEMGKPEQHIPMLRLIKQLNGKVMISGYPSKLYIRELQGWRVKSKIVVSMHAVQCYLRERREMIWMNY